LLAELAQRTGDFDEAEAWWRKLGAIQDDPDLTDEKLAQLDELRHPGPATEPEPEPEKSDFATADSTPIPDAEVLEAVPETDEETEPEPELVFPGVPAAAEAMDTGHTREIATLTLAGIYAEQGFKAKALEIYRAIAERNPELPGVAEKIAAIESAMKRVERGAVEGLEETDPKVAAGIEVVASVAAESAEEEDDPEPVRPEPLFSDVPGAGDPVASDASRYRRFGTWLNRVNPDED
jgi:tetratricopeptide (TPR) repeat protein